MAKIGKILGIQYRICSVYISILLFIMQIGELKGNEFEVDQLEPTYPEDKKLIPNLGDYAIDYNDFSAEENNHASEEQKKITESENERENIFSSFSSDPSWDLEEEKNKKKTSRKRRKRNFFGVVGRRKKQKKLEMS